MSKLFPKSKEDTTEITISNVNTSYSSNLITKLSGITGSTKPNIISLFDSVHDFGKSSIIYDTIYKKSRNISLHSLSQYVLSNYAFNIDNRDFLTLKIPEKSYYSIIPSNNVEDIFILDAIKDKTTTGKFYTFPTIHEVYHSDKTTHKNKIANRLYELFKPYFKDTGIIHGREQVIPCVIDTQNSFHKVAKQIPNKFAYLTIQEMISDSSKKISISSKTDYNDYFLVEQPNQTREYKVQNGDHYGYYNVKFSGLSSLGNGTNTNYYTNCYFIPHTSTRYYEPSTPMKTSSTSRIDILNERGTSGINQKTQFFYRIKMNELNHITSIPVIENQFIERIMKTSNYISLSVPPTKDLFYKVINSNKQQIETTYNIIELFSRKRYGDQLMGSFCCKLNNGKFPHLKVKSTKTNQEYNIKQCLLITGDRMLFAYAVQKNIPCILDMATITLCYVPNPVRLPTRRVQPNPVRLTTRQQPNPVRLTTRQQPTRRVQPNPVRLTARQQAIIDNRNRQQTVRPTIRQPRVIIQPVTRLTARQQSIIDNRNRNVQPPQPVQSSINHTSSTQSPEEEKRSEIINEISRLSSETATNANTTQHSAVRYISNLFSRVSSYFTQLFGHTQTGGTTSNTNKSLLIEPIGSILETNFKHHPEYIYNHLETLINFMYNDATIRKRDKPHIYVFKQQKLFKKLMENKQIFKIIQLLKYATYEISTDNELNVGSILCQSDDEEQPNIHYKMIVQKREDDGFVPIKPQPEYSDKNVSILIDIHKFDELPTQIKTELQNFNSIIIKYNKSRTLDYLEFILNIVDEGVNKQIQYGIYVSKFIKEILNSTFQNFDKSGLTTTETILQTITQHEECGAGVGASQQYNRRITRSMVGRGRHIIDNIVEPNIRQHTKKHITHNKSKSSDKTLKIKVHKIRTQREKLQHKQDECTQLLNTEFIYARNHLSLFNVIPFILPTIYAIPTSKYTETFKNMTKFINLQLRRAYYELVVHYDIRSMGDPDMRELFYEEHTYRPHMAFYTPKPELMMYKIFLHKLPLNIPVFFMEYIFSNISKFTENQGVIKTANAIHYSIKYLRQYVLNRNIEYENIHDLMFESNEIKQIFNIKQNENVIRKLLSILHDTRIIYEKTINISETIDKKIPVTYKKLNYLYGLYMGAQEIILHQYDIVGNKILNGEV
jgi:hypothetical protein